MDQMSTVDANLHKFEFLHDLEYDGSSFTHKKSTAYIMGWMHKAMLMWRGGIQKEEYELNMKYLLQEKLSHNITAKIKIF